MYCENSLFWFKCFIWLLLYKDVVSVWLNVLENVYNVSLIFYFLLLGYIIFFLKKINVLNFNLSMLVGFYFMIFNYE